MERCDEWLSADLDDWTRRTVRRHFDPVGGSPYWLGRLAGLGFDPGDITRYEQLVEFGPAPVDDLRSLDPADLVPRSVPRPLTGRVWDSGGTTGTPCRLFYTPAMLAHRGIWRTWSFITEGFRENSCWLQATPTGPHLIGNGTWEVTELFGGRSYAIDMDPRWVKRLLRDGRVREAAQYTDHLVDQIATVLHTQPIDYVNTTPALFGALAQREPKLVAELSGVRLSGTQLTPAMRRRFVDALDGGICGASYGNTFGNAASLPPENDGGLLPYVPNFPQVTMRVADRSDWLRTVPYGATGQVVLTVLHEDLFLPNILERDQAVRYDPGGRWPSDGVANVRPLEVVRSAPEGVY
ncbi:arylcarboxylate reductase [Kibdelosporangium persicum]